MSPISKVPVSLMSNTLISTKPAHSLIWKLKPCKEQLYWASWMLEEDVGGLLGSQPLLTVSTFINGTVATSLIFLSSKERRKRVCWSGNKSHELERGDFGWQQTYRQHWLWQLGSANHNADLQWGCKLLAKGPNPSSPQRYQSHWEFSVSRKWRNELQTFRPSSTWVVYYAWMDSHWLQQHSEVVKKALPKCTSLQNLGSKYFFWMLMRDFGGKVKPQAHHSCSTAFSPMPWYYTHSWRGERLLNPAESWPLICTV